MEEKRLEESRNESIKRYYLEKDYNCAEATLRTANDRLGLGLDESALKLVGGFGGGFGCGNTCGVLCGAIAALSAACIEGRAHATENFKPMCAEFTAAFEAAFGGTRCDAIKERCFSPEVRCLSAVEEGCALLERFFSEKKIR